MRHPWRVFVNCQSVVNTEGRSLRLQCLLREHVTPRMDLDNVSVLLFPYDGLLSLLVVCEVAHTRRSGNGSPIKDPPFSQDED